MRPSTVVLYLILLGARSADSIRGQDRITNEESSQHRLIVISKRSIQATLTFEVETKMNAREWFLFAPHPPETPGQITVTAKLSPGGRVARELSNYRRPILAARVKAGPQSTSRFQGELQYTMTLLARSLVLRRESDPPSDPEMLADSDRSVWVAPSPLCNYREREFQKWLDDTGLRRTEGEPDIDFARRVFLHLHENFDYEILNDMNRKATFICGGGKSDCMGLSVLFVSAMRANAIPARILVGRWAQSSIEGDTLGGIPYNKEHVKCEFFANDVGWVPVDVATALLQQREHVAMRCFGLDTADFITLHVNDQWIVQPGPLGRKTIPFVQDFAVWVIGQGEASPLKIAKQWRVTPLSTGSTLQGSSSPFENSASGPGPGSAPPLVPRSSH